MCSQIEWLLNLFVFDEKLRNPYQQNANINVMEHFCVSLKWGENLKTKHAEVQCNQTEFIALEVKYIVTYVTWEPYF